MNFLKLAAEIWRDYVLDGVPASGAHKPIKGDIRAWMATVEGVHEEGLWTPVLTFATPGNLAVSYSAQEGEFTRLGDLVMARFRLVTSSFTHTTASGDLRLTGLPFTNGGLGGRGALAWQGITKANTSEIAAIVSGATNFIAFQTSASGQPLSIVGAADMPTGGSVILVGGAAYKRA